MGRSGGGAGGGGGVVRFCGWNVCPTAHHRGILLRGVRSPTDTQGPFGCLSTNGLWER